MDLKQQQVIIEEKYKQIAHLLEERTRRRWVATETLALGYGGQRIVNQATGVSISTIRRGIQELRKATGRGPEVHTGRIRKKGGGRKRQLDKDKTLREDTLAIVESSTRGDPETSLLWNKIEHKMFCFIIKNWRRKPLIDRVTVVQLMGNTGV